MIYLDNAATTKIDPDVLSAMMPYLTDEYGNAGSLYRLGRDAKAAIDWAREQVATLFNCKAENVVFTSGGSESNSMVFNGVWQRLLDEGKKHLVISAIEHDSVIKSAEKLTKHGFYISYIMPEANGQINPRAVEKAIQEDTGLVSVMFINNETGAVNDVKEIGDICRQQNILFHTDCVQAAGQHEIDVNKICADFASVSSHKIHGSKGVGALYVRDAAIVPLIIGGSEQEFGLRGGTENVAGIVGFGKAVEIIGRSANEEFVHPFVMKQRFYAQLKEELEKYELNTECIKINGGSVIEPGKILNLCIDNVDAETLLLMLDSIGICISAGSACRSHEAEPSHVLLSMGLSEEEARSSIRISFSKYNTPEEIQEAAAEIACRIYNLRQSNSAEWLDEGYN